MDDKGALDGLYVNMPKMRERAVAAVLAAGSFADLERTTATPDIALRALYGAARELVLSDIRVAWWSQVADLDTSDPVFDGIERHAIEKAAYDRLGSTLGMRDAAESLWGLEGAHPADLASDAAYAFAISTREAPLPAAPAEAPAASNDAAALPQRANRRGSTADPLASTAMRPASAPPTDPSAWPALGGKLRERATLRLPKPPLPSPEALELLHTQHPYLSSDHRDQLAGALAAAAGARHVRTSRVGVVAATHATCERAATEAVSRALSSAIRLTPETASMDVRAATAVRQVVTSFQAEYELAHSTSGAAVPPTTGGGDSEDPFESLSPLDDTHMSVTSPGGSPKRPLDEMLEPQVANTYDVQAALATVDEEPYRSPTPTDWEDRARTPRTEAEMARAAAEVDAFLT